MRLILVSPNSKLRSFMAHAFVSLYFGDFWNKFQTRIFWSYFYVVKCKNFWEELVTYSFLSVLMYIMGLVRNMN